MRILHTSDWHLGHTLHGLSREAEHAAFMTWLLELLEEQTPDGLIIAGDIFDTACPAARVERAFFDFLAEARRRVPELDVVIVGGNHDSALRLEATAQVLKAINVHVVGSLHRAGSGALDLDRLLVPVHGASGAVGAWVALVPFLRPVDLPSLKAGAEGSESPLVRGVRAVYDEVLTAARERREPGQALLTTGHCTLVDTTLSEGSERKILGGLHSLPTSIFPDDVAYVALGHLHKAQALGAQEQIRYCGSPIPLSLAETNYVHEVRLIELEGERLVRAVQHVVPRRVDMLRVPPDGPLPINAVLPLLAELPDRAEGDDPSRAPYLEVRLAVEGSQPGLRRQVEEAVREKAVRLIKLAVTSQETGPALAEQRPQTRLGELDPREVFERCHQREHGAPPTVALSEAFNELLATVRSAPAGEELTPTLAEPRLGAGAA